MEKAKYECPHCEEECTISLKNDELEPITCPFCGGSIDEPEDDVLTEDTTDDEDNWN